MILILAMAFYPLLIHANENSSDLFWARAMPAGPGGYVLVEKEEFIDSLGLPTRFMRSARIEFKNKDYGEASASLRDAALVMTSQSKGTRDLMAKEKLLAAATSLDHLASDVRQRKIKDLRDLDRALASVTFHKAEYSHLRAKSEWAQKDYRRAGYDLKAAIAAADDSASYLGKELAQGVSASERGARDVSGKLIEDTSWSAKEVGSAFVDFGHGLELIGKNILRPPILRLRDVCEPFLLNPRSA